MSEIPYTPTNWVDGVTPVNETNLDKLEAGVAGALQRDEVEVAGTRLVANKLLLADANHAFRLMGSGKLEWGAGGASALDTNLYRSAANTLKSDDTFMSGIGDGSPGFHYNPATATGWLVYSSVAGEANSRVNITAAGVLNWGAGGASATDTNLYRSAADTLKTDDVFHSASEIVAAAGQAGQVIIGDDGAGKPAVRFGSGLDTNLYRSAANVLKTDDDFSVCAVGFNAAAGMSNLLRLQRVSSSVLSLLTDGNAYGTLRVDRVDFDTDVTLYRSAANVLKTDDSLEVAGSLTLGTNLAVSEMGSGTPSAGKYLDGAGSWTTIPVVLPTTNAQTGTSYTPVIGDANNIIELNNAAAITLTLPLNSSVAYPVGTSITIIQTGAGQVTVANGGTTLNANPGLKLGGQWAVATLLKRGTDTWILMGNLTA